MASGITQSLIWLTSETSRHGGYSGAGNDSHTGRFDIANRRKVQNHINGVHAAAMALLAESASGFLVGMNLPEHKLLLIKTLKVDYRQRVVGGLTAVASLTAEQICAIAQQERGELWVDVTVTDESGNAPIDCAMLWAWVTKK